MERWRYEPNYHRGKSADRGSESLPGADRSRLSLRDWVSRNHPYLS